MNSRWLPTSGGDVESRNAGADLRPPGSVPPRFPKARLLSTLPREIIFRPSFSAAAVPAAGDDASNVSEFRLARASPVDAGSWCVDAHYRRSFQQDRSTTSAVLHAHLRRLHGKTIPTRPVFSAVPAFRATSHHAVALSAAPTWPLTTCCQYTFHRHFINRRQRHRISSGRTHRLSCSRICQPTLRIAGWRSMKPASSGDRRPRAGAVSLRVSDGAVARSFLGDPHEMFTRGLPSPCPAADVTMIGASPEIRSVCRIAWRSTRSVSFVLRSSLFASIAPTAYGSESGPADIWTSSVACGTASE